MDPTSGTKKAEDAITVEFLYSPSDSIHAHRVYRATSRGHKVFIIVMLLVGCLYILLFGLQWQASLWFLLAIAEWFDIVQALKVRYVFRRNPQLAQELYKLTIDEKGILLKSSSREVRQLWSGFRKVIESEKAFVLEYGKGMCAVIPKHAFSSETSIGRARDLLRQKIEETNFA